ncbi:MAG: hypothetical protein Q9168_008214, partial [Polycauliona sp. 1 TL-2023]
MRGPPKPAVDSVSEASDDGSETSDCSETTSPLESTLTINVDPADTYEDPAKENLADLVRAQFVGLDLSSPSEAGLETPSTARDLYDATPRASMSPEPPQEADQPTPDWSPIEGQGDQLTNNIAAALQHLNLDHGRKTYNVKDETLPVMPVFDKKFQDCLKSGKAIAGEIHAGLSVCSLAIEGNSELGRLRAVAGRLKSFASPATRLIGIVGDSAAGKSSLINSLLDIPDLAHKGDHGSAVTSFVTEYHRRSSQHAAPFTIEVEYCNETEIDEQLYEILLREQGEGAFERILDGLKQLALLIEWPAEAANGIWTAIATSPVLADLPGYRDINLARVRKAEQYLLRCHEVFIVANINRVISDQSVEKFDIDLPAAARKYKRVVTSKAGTKALRARKHAWGPKGSAAAAQEADTEYKYLFIAARNAGVEGALRKRYESTETSLSINVFCIGNRDYEGAEFRSQDAHHRAIQGSGVPNLRRFCHSVVGQAQYDASIHFLEVELASLLQSLEVWLSVSEQENLVTIDPQIITDLQL